MLQTDVYPKIEKRIEEFSEKAAEDENKTF